MRRHTLFALISCALLALLTPLNETARAAKTTNRLATNRLATNRLATNRLATNRLASNALSSTRLEAVQDTQEMLATEDGREVYSYVVNCALPEDVTIEADVAGAPDTAPPDTLYACSNGRCVFYGGLGLAEEWLHRKLSKSGQRWVSACLLARVNTFAIAEAISLRGSHPNLTVSVDEAELYTIEEGAFYGNLFAKPGDNDDEDDGDDAGGAPGAAEDIEAYACRGRSQASAEFGGLVLRDCAEPDPNNPGKTMCGFNYAGDCADFTPAFPDPYACTTFDPAQGAYDYCQTTPSTRRHPPGRSYREVITVYVTN
jgi:hypothetical protein